MKKAKLLTNILIAGLIAGTLDILAAIFLLAGGNAAGVLKYVASGAFGQSAIAGGSEMVVWELLFHYAIALSWTVAFFFYIRNCRKTRGNFGQKRVFGHQLALRKNGGGETFDRLSSSRAESLSSDFQIGCQQAAEFGVGPASFEFDDFY